MKKFVNPLAILSVFFLSFCQKTENSFFTTFPQTYLHSDLEIIETQVFTKTIDGFKKIDPFGTFTNVQDELFSELKDGYKEILLFNKIDFISDSKASLKNDIPDNVFGSLELPASHTFGDNIIKISMSDLNNSGQITIPFLIDEPNNQIKSESRMVKCSFQDNGQTMYTIPSISIYPQTDINGYLKQTGIDNNLAVGDTIAVLISNMVFTKQ
jgi:hypothetical protein